MCVGTILLVAVVVALSTGCGSGGETSDDVPPTANGSGSQGGEPSGALFLRHVRGETITRVDLGTGRSKTVSLPELGPGDALYHLLRAGDRLVLYGASATYSLDLGLDGLPENLSESWYFVPSASHGHVWLMLLDHESSDTVRDLRGVRETTAHGRVTLAGSGRPPSHGPTIVAAVTDGLLFQQDEELRLWNPRTGRVTARFPGPFPVDTHGNLLASWEPECPRLHVTDVGAGDTIAIEPNGFRFEETYDGAFSPDGALFAVPAVATASPCSTSRPEPHA